AIGRDALAKLGLENAGVQTRCDSARPSVSGRQPACSSRRLSRSSAAPRRLDHGRRRTWPYRRRGAKLQKELAEARTPAWSGVSSQSEPFTQSASWVAMTQVEAVFAQNGKSRNVIITS